MARVTTAAGAPVIKFGQFIGQATVVIAAGDHVHTHNCIFANSEKDYAIGADLAAAQRAIPHTDLLTFSGYARSDGRIGTRNYIALVATVNRSATVIRRAASEIAASRLLEDYASVDGVVALAHGTGCGMANSGRGFDILDRVLWGMRSIRMWARPYLSVWAVKSCRSRGCSRILALRAPTGFTR